MAIDANRSLPQQSATSTFSNDHDDNDGAQSGTIKFIMLASLSRTLKRRTSKITNHYGNYNCHHH
jgi:hypothetical protein